MASQGPPSSPASAPVDCFPPIPLTIPQISSSAPHFSKDPVPPLQISNPAPPSNADQDTPPPKFPRSKPNFTLPSSPSESPKNPEYCFSPPRSGSGEMEPLRSSSPSQLMMESSRSPSPPRTSTTPPPTFTAASPTAPPCINNNPAPSTGGTEGESTTGISHARKLTAARSTSPCDPSFAPLLSNEKKRRSSARSPPAKFNRPSSPISPRRATRGEGPTAWIGTKPRKDSSAFRSSSHSPPLSPGNHHQQNHIFPSPPPRCSSHSPPNSRSPVFSHSPPGLFSSPPLLPPPSSSSSFSTSPRGVPPPTSPSRRTSTPTSPRGLDSYQPVSCELISSRRDHSFPPAGKTMSDEEILGKPPHSPPSPLKPPRGVVIGDPIKKYPSTTICKSTEGDSPSSPITPTFTSASTSTSAPTFITPNSTSTSTPASGSKKIIRHSKKNRLSNLHSTPLSSPLGSSFSSSTPGTKKKGRPVSPLNHSEPVLFARADSISLDKIKQWSDLAYFHHSKMKGIFEDLAGMKISDFSKPVMNEGDYKVFSYEESDDEQKALYDARTTLIDFQEDLRENFEKMFGVLPFLPLPWDEYTLFQVFHYKWLLVSFTSPAELRHLGALASAYEESCKNVYRAERERSKRKSILSRGLLGRFGKGRDKAKGGGVDDTQQLAQFDLKAVEKSLPSPIALFLRTMVNLSKYAEKFRLDPNGVIVGSQPCETLLAELSHLPLLSAMTHEQEQFNQKNRPPSPPPTIPNKKKGRGNKDSSSPLLLAPATPSPPQQKKRNTMLDEEVKIDIPDVPVTCLNTNMGAFPDRIQLIQRFVLWGRKLEEDGERVDIAEELEKLEKILAAEVWLEQVWQEGGGLLIPGELLIGIIPVTEIQRVFMETTKYCGNHDGGGEEMGGGGEEKEEGLGVSPALNRMQVVAQKGSSHPLMFCRFVGAKRHGLLVEIGGQGEPIFLTWQQAVPLPEGWKKVVKKGEMGNVRTLIADEKVGGRYQAKGNSKLHRARTNNKLNLEPSVLSLSAYALKKGE